MSSPIIYFITGANRGIGLALVQELVKKPDVYLFAGARTKSPALEGIISNHADKVAFVPYVAADEDSNRAAAKVVGDRFGRVDVVLGVAAISNYLGPAETTPVAHFEEHFKVNVTGILVLFQAFVELLRKSDTPKFIPFTSAVGSLTAYINVPFVNICYGSSKAALNYLSRKIHFENEWLICFPLNPGMVETDMARLNCALDKTGILGPIQDAMAISPEVAATMLAAIIDSATRESHGGEFINVDGNKIAW